MDIAGMVNLGIQLLSGLITGNATGAALKDKKDLGTLGNSISGLVGGGLGGLILSLFQGTGLSELQNLDVASIISSVVSGGAGGGVLTALIGMLKKSMGK